jgi:hypothetical protein
LNLVTEDGLFSIPMFHGTSDFFGNKIMAKGLGEANIIDSWRVIELAQKIVSLLDNCKIGKSIGEEAFFPVDFLRRMANQEITDGGQNFRHGSVYLSVAKVDALRYAENNKGSEILTTIGEVLDILPPSLLETVSDILDLYPNTRDALTAHHRSVIISAHDVPVIALCNENGGDPFTQIEHAQNYVNKFGIQSIQDLQQCCFELIAPISVQKLTMEYL